jgi:tellurite resistance protein TerC
MWIFFHVLIVFLLALDLGVFNKKAHEISTKEALGWSAFWIFLGLGFSGVIYLESGPSKAAEYLNGYLIEKALSVDNLFVFLVIFESLKIKRIHQHRLLFWGVFGAIILRAIMITLGVQLLTKFMWLTYIFGAFLIYTGIKLFKGGGEELDPKKSPIFKWATKFLPISSAEPNGRFTVVENGKRMFTTAFLALLLIESSDVIFAVDSVPAVFGVMSKPYDFYIIYTSNIFAILGLRSLFFVLESLLEKFYLLKIGLAAILVFVGTKMVLHDYFTMKPFYNLAVIGTILMASVILSLKFPKDKNIKPETRI